MPRQDRSRPCLGAEYAHRVPHVDAVRPLERRRKRNSEYRPIISQQDAADQFDRRIALAKKFFVELLEFEVGALHLLEIIP